MIKIFVLIKIVFFYYKYVLFLWKAETKTLLKL